MSDQPKETAARAAWDPENQGYGKHDYRHIDLEQVNVADWAQDMRGEQQHHGDVREINTAFNHVSEENELSLDLLSRVGTVFNTEAEGWEGLWKVTRLPSVRSPDVFCRATRIDESKGPSGPEGSLVGEEEEIPMVELGCAVGLDNMFKAVCNKLVKKGKHVGACGS